MAQVKRCDCCGRTGYELEDEKKPFNSENFTVQHKDRNYQVNVGVFIKWPEDVKDYCNDCAQAIAAKAIEQAYEATRKKRAPNKPKQPPETRQEVPVE